MWDEYFSGKCKITGIDICEERFKKVDIEKDNIRILLGDQSDSVFLSSLSGERFDVIVDDGSHIPNHQIITFNCLFQCLSSSGVYFIEDLHVAKSTANIFRSIANKKYTGSEFSIDILSQIDHIEFYASNKLCAIYKK